MKMALLPNIPTSFVPHGPGGAAPAQRLRSDLGGAYSLFAYAVLGIVFLMAIGVFFYGQLLRGTQASTDAEIVKAEANIDPATVEGFVRLKNRLNFGKTMLGKHIAFSNVFNSLGTVLPSSVRFVTLHLGMDSSGIARMEGTGVAKSFNALAALSAAFASDGRIKDAIFSKISVRPDSTVSFGFSATLDPKLIAFSSSVSSAPDTYVPTTITPEVQTVNPSI